MILLAVSFKIGKVYGYKKKEGKSATSLVREKRAKITKRRAINPSHAGSQSSNQVK
jgi:hypothetical protein